MRAGERWHSPTSAAYKSHPSCLPSPRRARRDTAPSPFFLLASTFTSSVLRQETARPLISPTRPSRSNSFRADRVIEEEHVEEPKGQYREPELEDLYREQEFPEGFEDDEDLDFVVEDVE
ncbi:hypothetical protein C2845_PM07G12920 [Panicum miliaceum]|uniref:Uncharacterized protein n=1 Tax=Panicum miliaceum TaxID=4540 RepID=A0A3L6SNU1_PANMI|nr:hypothetical protein C2845_PM07G12920 [Panicum miliaceum]